MPTITSEGTFPVGESEGTVTESVTVSISAAPVAPLGRGRLIHPIIGTYDYDISPDEWSNVDSDIIVPPIWSHTKTLTGVSSAQWQGYIKDVEVVERWNGRVVMHASQLRMLLDIWQNPPNPPLYVEWAPSYINSHRYQVQVVGVTCGGQAGINLDYLVLQNKGFAKGPLEVTYRVVAKVA